MGLSIWIVIMILSFSVMSVRSFEHVPKIEREKNLPYIVIYGKDWELQKFEQEVNGKLKEGYTCSDFDFSSNFMVQIMRKEEK